MTLKSLPNCRRSVRNDMRLFLRTKHYPVLLRTTKWKVLLQYYSTTLYSKVLLQYYSATKYYSSPTPVPQSTTKCYSVLKELLQCYKVLQSTTPVLLCTTSTSPVLVCTAKYYSSTTLYHKQHAGLILVTFETSFTMRRATGNLQPHQILHLTCKKTRMFHPRDWTSPNTAPATKSDWLA